MTEIKKCAMRDGLYHFFAYWWCKKQFNHNAFLGFMRFVFSSLFYLHVNTCKTCLGKRKPFNSLVEIGDMGLGSFTND